ncbi:succinate dehydrogenase, cytochrome b556 subunit [Polymorphobacter fuscus]|uniref:Succinate dehydrogenase cytochrome b556 subunit n=1 Tax=Sandarakinorhabdus fusca TaxID=1439888 RepID=A0A7C9GMF4_9SPHN|nr:succinate dehydrogenase, cytochrome b556 subunit [Polymorphobacter fuscus]KAB7648451.1 succinate dehydrogenase, cytochrome b556 subunit [Polymorphobacter fuscus]MQT15972.1 succinate dehydrogenase, cytochrome b556 subunit [Polymorphobacter fuscus]NJC07751.1 succinate dehydrogenase / fumarate reductase cytochrome b subunit [Polymorphobacter fuscus]
MAGRPTSPRPLSPHLTVWKWQVHAIVSILHRITGNAMALGAVVLFLWWLIAAATGPDAYAVFMGVATGWFGHLVAIGFTWVFFQHLFSGIRHLVMDAGQGYEIHTSRTMARATLVGSVLATVLTWAAILFTKGF